MYTDSFSALLTAYEQRLRPDASAYELARTRELKLNDRLVSFEFVPDGNSPDDGMVICRSDVLQFTEPVSEIHCRLLLQANNMWAGTQGSTLGLRGRDVLVVSGGRRIGSLDADSLEALVNTLCKDAQVWHRRMSGSTPVVHSQSDASQLPAMMHMRA